LAVSADEVRAGIPGPVGWVLRILCFNSEPGSFRPLAEQRDRLPGGEPPNAAEALLDRRRRVSNWLKKGKINYSPAGYLINSRE
jgi:hypothetical protein